MGGHSPPLTFRSSHRTKSVRRAGKPVPSGLIITRLGGGSRHTIIIEGAPGSGCRFLFSRSGPGPRPNWMYMLPPRLSRRDLREPNAATGRARRSGCESSRHGDTGHAAIPETPASPTHASTGTRPANRASGHWCSSLTVPGQPSWLARCCCSRPGARAQWGPKGIAGPAGPPGPTRTARGTRSLGITARNPGHPPGKWRDRL